jgi:hypothetical protein
MKILVVGVLSFIGVNSPILRGNLSHNINIVWIFCVSLNYGVEKALPSMKEQIFR